MHGRRASMREVVEAIDGPVCLNVCLRERRSCPRKAWCPAHPVWIKAQAAMLEVLGSAMIADLASVCDQQMDTQKTGTDNQPALQLF